MEIAYMNGKIQKVVFFPRVSFSAFSSKYKQAISGLFRFCSIALLNLAGTLSVLADEMPPNVLFIHVDDLRTQINAYGHSQMVTPSIDTLAAEGYLFLRAYAQQATCSPNRTALLTGVRPDTSQVADLKTNFRDTIPWVITLPQHFRNHGYHTVGIGKIYHSSGLNDELSWSEPWTMGNPAKKGRLYALEQNRGIAASRNYGLGPPTESADVADNFYMDGDNTDTAITKLATLKNQQPFYFGIGYVRPHLPFNAPQTYWDLYDISDLEFPTNRNHAIKASRFAYTGSSELRNYYGMPAHPIPLTSEQETNIIHGYYASVSYIDAQIGRLLTALKSEGLADNTIVVLWGDHGWHLGDHGQWTKHTNFEYATRLPLIIKVPGIPGNRRINALVETVDIYPTLAELCGLPIPAHVEGDSMVRLIDDPNAPWKDAVISSFPRSDNTVWGYSIRTDQYRYNEWQSRESGEAIEVELYDMIADMTQDINLAYQSTYASVVDSLSHRLKTIIDSWTTNIPELDIETLINNRQADNENDFDVPRIPPSDTVVWTYQVTNTGTVPISGSDIQVTDSQMGISPTLNVATDDGDGVLSPSETWTYSASAQALNLTFPPANTTIRPGCNDSRNTYENTGRVELAATAATGVFDEDQSHYCNMGDIDSDGITDSADNCLLAPNGPLNSDTGDDPQQDSDQDGYGNACDADLNNDCYVNAHDLGLFAQVFGSSDSEADLNTDGYVNSLDLGLLKSLYEQPPGPSGIASDCP
jgi:arylsulfatase A-like enzyme